MSLDVGTRLGPYELVGRLGAGGMGEVYRARDPRLGREVAIKVLPVEVSSDPDRLRRFEQEARAIAALNHSNILAVHDVGFEQGVSFIVTELLEGRTLRQLLTEERLAIPRVIDLAAQIADGLAAAHGRGMVHRDVKPENIHITEDGRAKILDFGLAKAIDGTSSAIDAPTQAGTAPFTVLGTAGYMAPEQVRGQPADHRADIFAFGAVLYEMIAGRRAFAGDNLADTMSAILRELPSPVLATPERPIPPALLRIVDRCLDKSAAGRFQSTTDLAFALKSLSQANSGALPPAASSARTASLLHRPSIAWTIAVASLAAAAAAWLLRAAPVIPQPVGSGFTFTIDPPAGTSFGVTQVSPFPEVSPDGQSVAFLAAGANEDQVICVRRFAAQEARPLPKTARATAFFWSPDSRAIAFFQDDALKRIDLDTSQVQIIQPKLGGAGQMTGAWGPDGTILFTSRERDGVRRVPIDGGEPSVVAKPAAGQILRHPAFLPDGHRFLYQSSPGGKTWVGSLDGAAPEELLASDSRVVATAPGSLLFVRDGTLFAQQYDARLKLVGPPRQVVEDVRTNPDNGRSAFSVSMNGVLVYRTGDWDDDRVLVWLNRKGNVIKVLNPAPANYEGIALLPGEREAIVHIHDAAKGGGDIFRVDLDTGSRTPLTTDPGHDEWPVLSPDGSEFAFLTDRTGTPQIFRKASSGAGAEAPWITHESGVFPVHWSRNFFVFEVDGPERGKDIWYRPLSAGAARSYMTTDFRELDGRLSPNEKWIVYQTSEGGLPAIFVRPFPRSEANMWRISAAGTSTNAFWSADGREVIYVERTPERAAVMSVPVTETSATITPGTPALLFHLVRFAPGNLAMSRDGQRFLVARSSARNLPSPLTVLLDWTGRLQKPRR